MAALMMARDHDPKYFLQVENRRTNVFVTQLGEFREEKDEDVSHIPIIREVPSKILQDDRKTLQDTLHLQKKAEHDWVTAKLIQKKQEFREQMEALAHRREEFIRKEQDSRMKALDFDLYLQNCELKRQRALKKYQRERELIKIKKREIRKLKEELKELKVRLEKLHKKVAKYKQHEDFLQKITRMWPTNYSESGADSVVSSLIKRHRTLLTAKQTLTANLSSLQQDLEKNQREFGILRKEHDTAKVLLSKISQLQAKSYTLQETNEQLGEHFSYEASLLRNQKQELSKMLLAISNMAEQCYMSHYGPLEEMPLLSKLDMIQESILEKMDIKQETMQSDLHEVTSQTSLKEQVCKKSKKRAISVEKL
ncbi:uncharacterized protein CCDC197 isoform X2 [Tiliqua scincoides]|uniref:uncharacterized protein CCDC197 isoform X2 n=1 Tax=Tiliqua scincoides TaxID=71010 RepID=UPI003461DDF5